MFYAFAKATDSNGISVDASLRKPGYKILISAIRAAKKKDGHVTDNKGRIIWFKGQLFTKEK